MPTKNEKPVTVRRGSHKATHGAGMNTMADLVKAARGQGSELVLANQVAGLGDDEVLVVVAGRRSLAARTVRLPRGVHVDMARGTAIAKIAVEQLGAGHFDAPKETGLTRADEELLLSGGFDNSAPTGVTPSEEGQLEFVKLLEGSLSAEGAARRLKVNPSRIRQRILAKGLLAIKDGATWRLPRFQFLRDRLVPGIERVLPALPTGMSAVAIQRWFNTPHPDLELEDSRRVVTPMEWLLGGSDPARVTELAVLLS